MPRYRFSFCMRNSLIIAPTSRQDWPACYAHCLHAQILSSVSLTLRQPFVSAALMAVLLLPVHLLATGHAAAQDETRVSAEVQKTRLGDPVKVSVEVAGFTGVGAVSLVLRYDPDVVRFSEGSVPEGTDALLPEAPRDNFSANVTEPGELRISWFDPTASDPISIEEGTLLEVTLGVYAGGETSVTFAEGSEISNIKAEPISVTFQDGRVGQN